MLSDILNNDKIKEIIFNRIHIYFSNISLVPRDFSTLHTLIKKDEKTYEFQCTNNYSIVYSCPFWVIEYTEEKFHNIIDKIIEFSNLTNEYIELSDYLHRDIKKELNDINEKLMLIKNELKEIEFLDKPQSNQTSLDKPKKSYELTPKELLELSGIKEYKKMEESLKV